MTNPDETTWELIKAAAAGEPEARDRFARVYEPLVRSFLARRWARGPLVMNLDDGVQEVFLACFRESGPLGRVSPDARSGFRGYLRGIVRNVARRFEEREAGLRAAIDPGSLRPEQRAILETSMSRAFDRRVVRQILREAAASLEHRAPGVSESAMVRVRILKLRFQDNLPVREIARCLGRDSAWVHHQYAKARREFRRALSEVVGRRTGGTPEQVEAHCQSLMELFG